MTTRDSDSEREPPDSGRLPLPEDRRRARSIKIILSHVASAGYSLELVGLLADLPHMRNEGVARSYTYALACIRFTIVVIVNSALSFVSGAVPEPIWASGRCELAACGVTKQLALAPYRCCRS